MPGYATTGLLRSRYPRRTYRTSSRYRYRYSPRKRSMYRTGLRTRSMINLSPLSNIEYKFIDYIYTGASYTTVQLYCLNSMLQGVTQRERIGYKVSVRGICISLQAYAGAGNDNATQNRFSIFVDRQCNGTVPSASDVGLSSVTDLYNPLFKARYYVLWDKKFTCAAFQDTGSSTFVTKYMYMWKTPIITTYRTSSGSLADIVTNSIYTASSGSATTSALGPFLGGTIRIYYTDD